MAHSLLIVTVGYIKYGLYFLYFHQYETFLMVANIICAIEKREAIEKNKTKKKVRPL